MLQGYRIRTKNHLGTLEYKTLTEGPLRIDPGMMAVHNDRGDERICATRAHAKGEIQTKRERDGYSTTPDF